MATYEELKTLIEENEKHKAQVIERSMTRNQQWLDNKYSERFELNEDDRYNLNVGYQLLNTMVTSIYNKDPEFSFELSTKLQEEFDKIVSPYGIQKRLNLSKIESALEKITQIYFREMNSTAINQQAVYDVGWAGFGCTKMGYDKVINPAILKLKKEKGKDFRKFAETITTSSIIQKDMPFKVRINPLDILLDMNAPSPEYIQWICQKIYLTQDQAKRLYGIQLATESDEGDHKDKVLIYEFHSLDPNDPNIYVLNKNRRGFLEKRQHPLYDGKNIKNMFQILYFTKGINTVYPKPDLNLVEDQIRELNRLVERRVSLIKQVRSVYGGKGILDPEIQKKFSEADDGDIIPLLENGDIFQVPPLQLTTDFYNNISLIKSEMFEVLGLTDYSLGGSTQKRKATEANFVEHGMMNRVNWKIQRVDRFVFTQGDTFIEIMKRFNTLVRKFKLVDGRNSHFEFPFSGLLLKTGDIDIQVVPGSTVTPDKNIQLNRDVQLLQVAQTIPHIANVEKIWRRLCEHQGLDADEYTLGSGQQAIVPGSDGVTQAIKGRPPIQGQPSMTPQEGGQFIEV